MTTAVAKVRSMKKRKSGSSTLGKTKHGFMNKTARGSDDLCPRSTEEKDEHPEDKEVTFIILKKT